MTAAAPSELISNWGQLIEGFRAKPSTFYGAITASLKERKIPGTKCKHINWPEGAALGAKREYLRVQRKSLVFDICAAPFGSGFFVSWWLGELPGFWTEVAVRLGQIPVIGILFRALISASTPMTYYKIDSAMMFRDAVRKTVEAVIDKETAEQGLRSLTELERQPIHRDFFA